MQEKLFFAIFALAHFNKAISKGTESGNSSDKEKGTMSKIMKNRKNIKVRGMTFAEVPLVKVVTEVKLMYFQNELAKIIYFQNDLVPTASS